jgi:hypothetical protein
MTERDAGQAACVLCLTKLVLTHSHGKGRIHHASFDTAIEIKHTITMFDGFLTELDP